MYTRARPRRPSAVRHTRQQHRDGMNHHARAKADRLFNRVYRRAKGQFLTVSRCPNRIVGRTDRGLLIQRRLGGDAPTRPALIEWKDILAAIDLLIMDGFIGRRELMTDTSVRDTSAVMGLLHTFGGGIQLVVLLRRRLYLRCVEVRVYFSGLENNPSEMDLINQVGGHCLLYSFATIGNWTQGRGGAPPRWLTKARECGFSLLLDSGAFGFMRAARSKGETPDWEAILDRYCSLIKRWGIRHYVALDVIGDWQLTRRLLITMYQRGLRPIPVFHMGDPWEYLDWLVLKLGAPLIGLGGAAKAPDAERTRWLDEVFHRYPAHCQMFHGFGMASLDTIARYPFLSIDASTPFSAGRAGEILTDLGRVRSDLPRLERIRHNFAWMLSAAQRTGQNRFQLHFPMHLPDESGCPADRAS